MFNSRKEIARLVGVSEKTIERWANQGMPGETGNYSLPDIWKWRLKYELDRQEKKLKPVPRDEDEALLYADADSPNLERLRAAKADIAEDQRDEKRGYLVRIDELSDTLQEIAALVSSCTERAQQRGDAETYQDMRDTLLQYEARLEELFGDHSDEGEAGTT